MRSKSCAGMRNRLSKLFIFPIIHQTKWRYLKSNKYTKWTTGKEDEQRCSVIKLVFAKIGIK